MKRRIAAGVAVVALSAFGCQSAEERQAQELRGEIGDLRDRMGRVEGYLDVLREFFVGSGRGTAA